MVGGKAVSGDSVNALIWKYARTLNNVVLASYILHNICEIQNNEFLPQWEEFERAEEVMVVADNVFQADANDIRNALADHFSH